MWTVSEEENSVSTAQDQETISKPREVWFSWNPEHCHSMLGHNFFVKGKHMLKCIIYTVLTLKVLFSHQFLLIDGLYVYKLHREIITMTKQRKARNLHKLKSTKRNKSQEFLVTGSLRSQNYRNKFT